MLICFSYYFRHKNEKKNHFMLWYKFLYRFIVQSQFVLIRINNSIQDYFIITLRFVILLHISVKDGGGILASWQGKYMCAIQSISLKSSLAFIVSKGLFVLLHRETFLFFVAIQNPLYIYCEG